MSWISFEPVAESLSQAAYAYFQRGQSDQALPLLRQVIATNPNHQQGAQFWQRS